MSKKRIIWIIDDHRIVANGIAAILTDSASYQIQVFYEQLILLNCLQQHQPDLLIADYNMPGMDPVHFFSTIHTSYPSIKIIVLSMHDSPRIVQEAIHCGVNAFVLKQNPEQELQHAVEMVLAGASYFSSELIKSISRLQRQQENFQLTTREKEILQLLSKAFTSKEIAASLYISERTVETHRKNLLRKTGTSNTTALLTYARDHFFV